MRRGDLVTLAITGDYGKPRPALVIQSDHFDATATVTVVLLSSKQTDAPLIRLPVQPTANNGLRKTSEIMMDKVMTVKRERMGRIFGRLDDETLVAINRSLALFLGFA